MREEGLLLLKLQDDLQITVAHSAFVVFLSHSALAGFKKFRFLVIRNATSISVSISHPSDETCPPSADLTFGNQVSRQKYHTQRIFALSTEQRTRFDSALKACSLLLL